MTFLEAALKMNEMSAAVLQLKEQNLEYWKNGKLG
jgi:hypothetical protein